MTEIKDLEPRLQKGFKINYTKVREAVLKCELEAKESQDKQKCKKMFEELGIDLIE